MDTDFDDTQSLDGTTLAASTFSVETITAASSSTTQLEHRFFKGNGLTSKTTIRASTGTEYRLVAHIHRNKPSSMQMFAGKDKSKSSSLGTLEFASTYNSFQIHVERPNAAVQHIQVRARVGYPHPSSYSFTLPPTAMSKPRRVAWTAFGPRSGSVGYHLREEGTNTLIASWNLCSQQKHQAVLRWHVDPGAEVLETAVVLSFIGCLARLKLKGNDDSLREGYVAEGGIYARLNGMWYMGLLGAVAVG